jgi:hypothetical protein
MQAETIDKNKVVCLEDLAKYLQIIVAKNLFLLTLVGLSLHANDAHRIYVSPQNIC